MVIADFSGNYLNAETCHNEDIGVVLNEGKIENKTSKLGKDYKALAIEVEVNGKKMTYEVFDAVGKVVSKKWGNDTSKWIGKKFKCLHTRYTSYGQPKVRVDIEPLE